MNKEEVQRIVDFMLANDKDLTVGKSKGKRPKGSKSSKSNKKR